MHDSHVLEDQPIAWTPTPDVIERAQLTRFMKQVGVSTWTELYEFSIRDVELFTEEVLKFLDIRFDPPYSRLLDTSGGIEFPSWFVANAESGASSLVTSNSSVSAGLNITTMCLDRWQADEMKDQPAVIWEGEAGNVVTLSMSELLSQVTSLSAGMRAHGFTKGDAIGIFLPMTVETVVSLLAINRIGAIAVPVFSGYGVDAVASRMNAVNATALITCDRFERRGKHVDAISVAKSAADKTPSIRKVIVSAGKNTDGYEPFDDERYLHYWDVIDSGEEHAEGVDLGHAEPTSAEDPLIILYTSGTTGKPKGIAHTHASFPVKAAQDMAFGTDVGRGTRISWYTDIGWMMGPWLIYGALINGATICIYDGAPDYPTHDRMWEFCARHKVEILGISPTLVRALASQESQDSTTPASQSLGHPSLDKEGKAPHSPPVLGGVAAASADGVVLDSPPVLGGVAAASADGVVLDSPPVLGGVAAASADGVVGDSPEYKPPYQRHDLSSLRAFASTGEPWNPAPWWWLFEKVGNSKLPIINYSGGTEIAGGILMGNPLLPIKPCSFPAPCPGMDVDILDERGEPVGPNQVGELVVKQPWIGMARGFWKENERYLETYWRRFPNIWVHGDWAMRDKDEHWFILGRSDDTLKVAGKRVGPAEVESLLVAHPLVTEAAVIGVPDEVKGTAMVAFCVLSSSSVPSVVKNATTEGTEGTENTELLTVELRNLVAKDMGKPLAPSKIHFVSALPKTRNAKVMRRVIRAAYLCEDPGDLSALENPKAVDEIRSIASTN